MLAVLFCLAGVLALLIISELLGRKKILRGDPQRQFVHISVGSFIAFWPWLISFKTIALIGAAMLAVVLVNYRVKLIDIYTDVKRRTYGDIFYALAIIFCALLTDEKVFFAIAMLTMAIGDGLANVIGQRYGKKMQYKSLGHSKTVFGSMAIWFVSLFILGVGLLFAHDMVDYSNYVLLLIFVPPTLVVIENASLWGIDNLAVPVAVLVALNLAQ